MAAIALFAKKLSKNAQHSLTIGTKYYDMFSRPIKKTKRHLFFREIRIVYDLKKPILEAHFLVICLSVTMVFSSLSRKPGLIVFDLGNLRSG